MKGMVKRVPYVHSWEEPSEEEQQLTEALVFLAIIEPEQLSDSDKQQLRQLRNELRRYSKGRGG
jgi:hypothetical protein